MSVITPVLDRVGMIGGCLESVSRGTYPNVEHIVVDGGSRDGTVELLRRTGHRDRLRWTSGPDAGMYDAVNRGLRMAHGDILAYLNSDDRYLPWTLETAVSALEAGADLVYGDLLVVVLDAADGPDAAYVQFYGPFDRRTYTYVRTLAQPTVVWRREVSDRIGGFDTSYRLLGDCDYWLRAAAAGFRLVYIPEVLAVQVEHAGTLRRTAAERLSAEFRRLRAEHGPAAGPPPSPRRAALQRSLAWRRHQLRLRRELARRRPQRWPAFAELLRSNGLVPPWTRVLQFTLPARLRGPETSWFDAQRLSEVLASTTGPAHG